MTRTKVAAGERQPSLLYEGYVLQLREAERDVVIVSPGTTSAARLQIKDDKHLEQLRQARDHHLWVRLTASPITGVVMALQRPLRDRSSNV